jgi:hypothetical protein
MMYDRDRDDIFKPYVQSDLNWLMSDTQIYDPSVSHFAKGPTQI